jgi:hypothetical protein
MRVTTCMFFWAEPLDELWSQVTALEGLSDRLVAVNGRWDGFPTNGRDTSREEIATVVEAAERANIDVTVHRPHGTWPGEVAQRNYTLKLALTDADWVFLMDADERVVHVGPNVRDDLEKMDRHVGTLEFHTLDGDYKPATQWETAGQTTEQRRFFRATSDLRYEKHHWWLRTDSFALWGQIPGLRFAKARKLDVRVEHRTCVRDPERWVLKDEFRAVRDPADAARGWEY